MRRQAVDALQRLRHGGRPPTAAGMADQPVLPALLAAAAAAAAAAPPPAAASPELDAAARSGGEASASGRGGSGGAASGRHAAGSAANGGHDAAPPPAPALRVLCRSRAQVDAALSLDWLGEVVLDFLEVQGLKEACAAVRR